MPEWINCPLCQLSGRMEEGSSPEKSGQEDLVFVLAHHNGDARAERFRFVRCTRCGLIYVNPRPTWDERQKYYDQKYPGYHHLKTEISGLQRFSMRYGLEKRCRIVTHLLPPGRLLEVGCGGGDFAALMSQKPGWQVCAFDRSADILGCARQYYPELNVLVSDLAEAPFLPGSFDVITLWTVLEHLADPAAGLRACARLLRPGGLLVIRTICLESWARSLFGSAWLGYDAPRILTIFSRSTLRDLLEVCGFELGSLGEIFHDFHPYLWSLHNRHAGRQKLLAFASSWPARLLSLPFFMLQTALGRNSFLTATAWRTKTSAGTDTSWT